MALRYFYSNFNFIIGVRGANNVHSEDEVDFSERSILETNGGNLCPTIVDQLLKSRREG